jgi:circadian clock protein KaiC
MVSSIGYASSLLAASVMMTTEIPELFSVSRVSENGMPHLSDNVVMLQYVTDEGRFNRALTILKTRASRHQPAVCGFEITREGISLSG